MGTFAPLLADSLEGFNKYFLSFIVPKGVQDLGDTRAGIKGIKGGKHLSHLLTLYSCLVCGWVAGVCNGVMENVQGTSGELPSYGATMRGKTLVVGVLLGGDAIHE